MMFLYLLQIAILLLLKLNDNNLNGETYTKLDLNDIWTCSTISEFGTFNENIH